MAPHIDLGPDDRIARVYVAFRRLDTHNRGVDPEVPRATEAPTLARAEGSRRAQLPCGVEPRTVPIEVLMVVCGWPVCREGHTVHKRCIGRQIDESVLWSRREPRRGDAREVQPRHVENAHGIATSCSLTCASARGATGTTRAG